MSELRRFLQRLLNALRPSRREAELEREFAAHLALIEEECLRRGASAEDARRSARMMLGGVAQTKELHRDARSFEWLGEMRRNVSYAVRMFRRRPVASMAAMLSLALGIGLGASIFSVLDWVLLRPLPFSKPHELVRIFTAGTTPPGNPSPVTYT